MTKPAPRKARADKGERRAAVPTSAPDAPAPASVASIAMSDELRAALATLQVSVGVAVLRPSAKTISDVAEAQRHTMAAYAALIERANRKAAAAAEPAQA